MHSRPKHWLLCHLGLYKFEFEFFNPPQWAQNAIRWAWVWVWVWGVGVHIPTTDILIKPDCG